MLKKIKIAALVVRLIFCYMHYFLALDMAMIAFSFPPVGLRERAVILVVLILSYFLRERMPRVFGIVLIHILLAVGVFFLIPDPGAKWILIIEVMIEAFMGASYITAGYSLAREYDIPWPSFILLAFITITGLYLKQPSLVRECFIIAVLIYMLYILIIYLQNLEDYVRSSRNISGIPMDKIIPLNSVIVLGIFTLMGVMVFLADKMGFGGAVASFLKASVKVLFMFFRLIGIFLSIIFGLVTGGGGSTARAQDYMVIKETVEEAGLLDDIVYFMLKLIVLIIAFIIIFRFFRWLIRYLAEKRLKMSYDTITKISKPDMSDTKVEKIVKEKKEGYFTPEQKARRIYKKRVETVKKKYVPKSNQTTGDIIESYRKADLELKKDKAADITELTELYEAVRYGNVHPDINYLKDMQNS